MNFLSLFWNALFCLYCLTISFCVSILSLIYFYLFLLVVLSDLSVVVSFGDSFHFISLGFSLSFLAVLFLVTASFFFLFFLSFYPHFPSRFYISVRIPFRDAYFITDLFCSCSSVILSSGIKFNNLFTFSVLILTFSSLDSLGLIM